MKKDWKDEAVKRFYRGDSIEDVMKAVREGLRQDKTNGCEDINRKIAKITKRVDKKLK